MSSSSPEVLDGDDQADLEEALQFVQGRWREIGTQLHLKPNNLDTIRSQNLEPVQAMGKVVSGYLSGNYNVKRFGPPTWKKIVEAVEKPAGGGSVAEAERIAKSYADNVKIKSSYSRPSRSDSDNARLPEPVVQPYKKSHSGYFPHADGEKVQVDGLSFKLIFERFAEWSLAERLKGVQLSFGAVQPQEGGKKPSIAGTYDMSKWPHGVCLIINNEKFESQPGREGTNLDEANMVQTFRHLGYIVEVHRDCKAMKIKEIIEDIRKRDHSKFDSFICCILSHGNAGHIYGSDSILLPLDDITLQLSGEKCRSLISKPKLFFLQACRGLQKDKAVRVQSDSGGTGIQEQVLTDSGAARMATDSDVTIPDAADFFFSYATPINQVAWRDLDNGSWYVSELCKSLTSYGTFASLLDMVTRTNGEVARGYSYKDFKQEPDFNSRLRKNVFFF